MRKKMEWQWERLDNETARAKVIGGWLVNHLGSFSDHKKTQITESMVFLPDRDHEWHITPPLREVKGSKSKVIAADFEPAVFEPA